MAEYSRFASGNFTATSASQVVVLPFQPDYVELWNYTNILTAGTHKVTRAWWNKNLIDPTGGTTGVSQNPTMVELYAGSSTAVVFDTIQTNGISTFSGGLMLQYGPVYQHTASTDFQISKAATAQITTSTNHNLQTGDVVIFSNLYQTSTTGMQQIAGIPFMITNTGATTFTIKWDTSGSNYTAFNTATSTNNLGSYKKVLYPDLYFPGSSIISAITTGATTTIKTTDQHDYQVGQQVAFHIPNIWGTTQLNELPNASLPGSPITAYVISVTDAQTVVVNINSTGYTAFVPNQVFSTTSGKSFPQIVAVGDVNTGGVQISSGSQLYPPPQFSYATKNDSNTINGPAIIGAYVNNTRQGFVVGSGACNVDTSSAIMASTNQIFWRASLADFSNS